MKLTYIQYTPCQIRDYLTYIKCDNTQLFNDLLLISTSNLSIWSNVKLIIRNEHNTLSKKYSMSCTF